MAQAKSSSQRSLQDILNQSKNLQKDSIEGLTFLEQGVPQAPAEKAPIIIEETTQKESKPVAQSEPKEIKKAVPQKKPAEKKKEEPVAKAATPKAPRLIAPKKELKNVKVGFIITEKAKKNLMHYTDLYQFRSSNDFINELLENLDLYFNTEE